MISFESYLAKAERNLLLMSRTANGIIDVSASRTKAEYMQLTDGRAAGDAALTNVRAALRMAYDEKNRAFSSADELKQFVTDLALRVNEGIVRDGCLFRQGMDSDKYRYARIADIEWVYDRFCSELFDRLCSDRQDPVETACFCEYLINPVGHFFSDGCSKVSMVVSAYVLMRAGLPLPSYRGRDEYYHALGESRPIPSHERIIDPKAYAAFLAYFRSLF